MDLFASSLDSLPRMEHAKPKESLTCDECGARFKKSQHLMRHTRRHLQDRPHECPFCAKKFPRKDTLKRHVGIHGTEASSIYATRAAAESTRTPRACRRCNSSKKRCDGFTPCSQCARKGQSCVYDHRYDRRVAVPCDARAPDGGEAGNDAAWFSDMSAPALPTPLEDNGQLESMSCDEMVAAEDSCGIYSELNHHSRCPQQDPAFDLILDPFFFWDSEATDGLLDHLPNATNGVAAKTSQTGVEMNPAIEGAITSQEICPDGTGDTVRHTGEGTIVHLSDLPCNDREILASEQYYHVPPISNGLYSTIHAFWIQHCVTEVPTFPDADILNTFMQMYFEFCHEELPLFHLPTFDPSPESWIVVAGIIAIGCNYSVSRYRLEVSDALLKLLHRAVSQRMTDNTLVNGDLALAQGIFLFNLGQLFHGTKGEFLKLQYQRNILITLCRRHMAQASSMFNAENAADGQGSKDTWKAWVREESWRRLAYSTWMLECFQWIMFDTRPILASSELRLGLPCHEGIWKSANQSQWEQLASNESFQPCISTIINSPSMLTSPMSPLGSFASLIVMLSLSAEEKTRVSLGHGVYGQLISSSCMNAQSELRGTDRGFQLQASGIAPLRQKLFRVLSILHQVQLRLLYRASGWLTSSKDRDAAKRELFTVFSNNRSTARRTLRHAATLFRLIKIQRKMSYCDPQMFLIATLYIWSYAEISGFRDRNNPSSLAGWDRPLRIDQELDEDMLEEWITNGDQRPVHITSVGILQDSDSCIRLLNEGMRVLRHETAWARIGRGIAQAIERILMSGTTSFDGNSPYQNTII
ncbi:fungal-specific transcription factor domain-containing protein [Aspergillus californicus]